MSETSVYFVLAQLFTLMTASLRLSLAFLLLALLAEAVFQLKRWPDWSPQLADYWRGWMGSLGLAGALFAGLEALILNYPNPFVRQGIYLGLGLALFSWILGFLRTGDRRMRLWLLLLALIVSFWLPPFSRSTQTWITVIFAWPVALSVSYLCLWLWPRGSLPLALRNLFHGLWGMAALSAGWMYCFWLYPRVSGLPPVGEFYPFIHLYDWFLVVFMILYSGNLYIDYWLKERKKNLILAWNYGVVLVALLCLWLNTSIFDTLAL